MSFAAAERQRLAELLRAKGPDAPTLCEGWTTADLATHLLLREQRPDAAAGILVRKLSSHTAAVTQDYESRFSYEEIVDRWAAGLSRWNPLRVADSLVNTCEHFVHYEDVARAEGEWEPRDFSAVVNDALFRGVDRFAPIMLKKSTAPVHLVAPGRTPITVAARRGVAEHGDAGAWVYGDPGELLLWVYGRDAVRVRIEGDAECIVRSSI
ncbi:TIGR03085 family metal-binding protein [Corynebacterium uropygiale]|uniref:TIGR03085 family metal-binding protein n=1 Tax=Corynebacterium uropygiale TaxID=1775911 RepID=A0A9X1TXS3_9CORY|nr:TIGR03085 family metal-binding protein [Corynebacterium uropygiale]MCF4006440.1 TIGR03085 family metal-binding protein [Corynebacterium uropygiale]